ncbi:MAG: DUF1285 domain-containing protein [Gammaproteobacteria bacterium]
MARRIKRKGPAPVHLWNPQYCGEIDMRIARDGSWFHEGKPIRRIAMVQLFASILRLDDDGEHYLVTPVEKVRIEVEDCPFVMDTMDISGAGKQQVIRLSNALEESVEVDAEHPLSVTSNSDSGEPHPVVEVRSGLQGLLNRAVFYRLVEQAEQRREGDTIISGVWSKGQFFELGRVAAESS